MPFNLVQTNFATSASAQNQAGAMASAVNAGDLIVAFVMCFQAGAATLNSVTDTSSNVYTPILGPIVNGSTQLWLLFCGSAAGAGAGPTITANFSATVTSPVIGWSEFSPASILNTNGSGSGSATGTGTAMTTAGVTTGSINGLAVGWFGNGSSVITAAGGSTQLFTGGASGFEAQYKLISGAGGKNQQANNAASVSWAEVMAIFVASSGGVSGSLIGAADFWGGGFS